MSIMFDSSFKKLFSGSPLPGGTTPVTVSTGPNTSMSSGSSLASLLKTIAPFVPLGTTYMGNRQSQSAARISAAQAQQAAQMTYQQQMAVLAEQRRQAEEEMKMLQAQFEVDQMNKAAAFAEQQRMNEASLGMSQERLAMEKAARAEATAERERLRQEAAPYREATLAYLNTPIQPFRPSIGLYKR
jgi:septal ring factor EnvC (AmiA/AmiB activator)